MKKVHNSYSVQRTHFMFTADMFKWTMNVIRATVVREMTIHLKKEQRKILVSGMRCAKCTRGKQVT